DNSEDKYEEDYSNKDEYSKKNYDNKNSKEEIDYEGNEVINNQEWSTVEINKSEIKYKQEVDAISLSQDKVYLVDNVVAIQKAIENPEEENGSEHVNVEESSDLG
ncbi:414_t:CDS:2, partial [Dentiscutata erythropus]